MITERDVWSEDLERMRFLDLEMGLAVFVCDCLKERGRILIRAVFEDVKMCPSSFLRICFNQGFGRAFTLKTFQNKSQRCYYW